MLILAIWYNKYLKFCIDVYMYLMNTIICTYYDIGKGHHDETEAD